MQVATDHKMNDRRLGPRACRAIRRCPEIEKGLGNMSRRDSRNKVIGAMGFGHARWSRDPRSVEVERAPPSAGAGGFSADSAAGDAGRAYAFWL